MHLPYIFLLAFSIAGVCMAAEEKPAPDWTYDDDRTGQEDWGAIPGYETCESGMQQSPIIISYTKSSYLPALNFKYNNATGLLSITRKSFIMNVANGGELIDGNNKYTLQSIELHSPGGHRIHDTFYPLEIHLIHKNSKGDLLIVAIFANIGADNQAISDMIRSAYSHDKSRQFTAHLTSLLNNGQSYYSYAGSLPYPPCTENVQWRIIKAPVTISHEQLSTITKFIARNTRLPQPVYIREVLENN